MANKRRRCTSCKKYKEADEGIVAPIGFFCDKNCRYDYATKNTKKIVEQSQIKKEKAARADLRARKEKFKTAGDYIKEAQTAVNKYIRLRDRDKPCVSCGCELSVNYGGTTDCGHYRSRGSAGHLRFNLLNMWAQCSRCNRYLSGNVVEYRKELINRIGVDRVELLENDNNTRKFTIEYLKRIKRIFNKRARFYQK